MSTSKNRKLLEETSEIMRLRHYSIHTERACCDWIKRYVRYHEMTCRNDLKDGEAKLEAFLFFDFRHAGSSCRKKLMRPVNGMIKSLTILTLDSRFKK
jgi:hypothetical protein